MISNEELNTLYDAEILDQDGEKIGTLGEVYLDNRTGDPAWLTVRAGWFAGRKVFVPMSTAEVREGQIQVPYSTDKVKGAPDILADGHLSEDDEQDLYIYYRMDDGPAPSA
ncbi:PRC-barrel domain-containing protein [Ornithinimicrobium cerasi]|uniref:PRC-barrel domain-containing protein n=1 Tax=Ornithinimicrobium cerasi TaxID=2248773 RepID=A0A285VEM3_9MICO|nr:PRC-barrel domain-containing protein [Ornithinimicrobium cerasi]SOC52417.1 PRC-barrel domain-containing protein [Ornithinimicrobium cerasi]